MALILEKVQVWQDDWPLFQPLSFKLQGGDVIVLQGANGVGKTTLLRGIAGLRPLAGTIQVQRPHVCYIGHQLGLDPYLTVAENCDLFLANTQFFIRHCEDPEGTKQPSANKHGNRKGGIWKMVKDVFLTSPAARKFYTGLPRRSTPRNDEGMDVLTTLQLEALAHYQVRHLSAGQQRRVALLRLFQTPPAQTVYLLDEPDQNLDAAGRALLYQVIAAHRGKGGAFLMVHHGPWDKDPSIQTMRLTQCP